MAAKEWVVLTKQPSGGYREVFTPAGARPMAENSFGALEAIDPSERTAEMYTVKANDVDTWILIPEGDRPISAALVKVLPDGSLQQAGQPPAPPATP